MVAINDSTSQCSPMRALTLFLSTLFWPYYLLHAHCNSHCEAGGFYEVLNQIFNFRKKKMTRYTSGDFKKLALFCG